MLDDIFKNAEDLLSEEKESTGVFPQKTLAVNCADKLKIPQIPRRPGYPIGIKNQSPTNTFNSIYQILFHTPKLRRIILQLPLCLQNALTPSGFRNSSKHSFLLGFQRLFSEMSACDQQSIGTEYLNKTFKLHKGYFCQQYGDIQEAMTAIFDLLQTALKDTEYYEPFKSIFEGSLVRYKTCRACGKHSELQQPFYDIKLQVQRAISVKKAFFTLTTPQVMEEDNAIFCNVCKSEQDMWCGTRLKQLPNTLILTLSIFKFDYLTFKMTKLNTYFEYEQQLDLSVHMMSHSDPDYCKYELYAVVIHRGPYYGGHYLCYVRDKQVDQRIRQINPISEEVHKQQVSQPKPNNKNLLYNWYQIHDSIVTSIEASKLPPKYQESDTAYMLFYRRKSQSTSKQKVPIPTRFKKLIIQANQMLAKEREVYQFEKQHIILYINGFKDKMKGSTTVNYFKQAFITQESSLVAQSKHNGLPYYPMQIFNTPDVKYQPQETLFTLQVPHQSKWKTYQISTLQYQQIKPLIGKSRLPLEVVLLLDGEITQRMVIYNDEKFSTLRVKIEKLTNIPYDYQIIILVNPSKQTKLTDNLTNDDLYVPQLEIIHGTKLMVRSSQLKDREHEVRQELIQ